MGLWRQIALSRKAYATLAPTHVALIVDHTPNKDRNSPFQLFRTMLTNKQKQWWNYQTEKHTNSLPREKKTQNAKNL